MANAVVIAGIIAFGGSASPSSRRLFFAVVRNGRACSALELCSRRPRRRSRPDLWPTGVLHHAPHDRRARVFGRPRLGGGVLHAASEEPRAPTPCRRRRRSRSPPTTATGSATACPRAVNAADRRRCLVRGAGLMSAADRIRRPPPGGRHRRSVVLVSLARQQPPVDPITCTPLSLSPSPIRRSAAPARCPRA